MSYRRVEQSGDPLPIDTSLYWRDDMRAAIAKHDFTTVYRVLRDEQGLSQRRIATLTGQSQSEVSEILSGRRVLMYSVLQRIVSALAIPPEMAGISWHGRDGGDAYPGSVTIADPEGVEALLRRHLLGLGGRAITGATVAKLGMLLAELPEPPATRLPTQLSQVHVSQVQDVTRRLAEAGNQAVCAPDMLSAGAAWAFRLLDVAGAESVKQALKVAIAELHIEAGWAAFYTDLAYRRALYHYARALDLAIEAEDTYLQAIILRYAGMATAEQGHPNDGLKMLQCAQVAAWNIPQSDKRAVVVGETGRAAVEATGLANGATVLTLLGDHDTAGTYLRKSRELWTPTRAAPFGDLDRPAAELEIQRGRLDRAEQLATTSLRRWDGGSPISQTLSATVLATIHVRAGEADGLGMAYTVITSVSKLRSARTRKRLVPLADALDIRRGTDSRDLARQARQVATTRG
ncbi:MAG: helix-turn-helix domain-containing protein [Pseudonocardiaceae bacterium]